jgi:hypothetical protein
VFFLVFVKEFFLYDYGAFTAMNVNIKYFVYCIDDCSYVRHSPAYKPERNPLRGVYGSYLRQSGNVEMASSLQRVEKNSR